MKTKLLTTTIALLLGIGTLQNAHADLPLDTPTEDFTDNGDGTVLHKKTGLTWQRCAVGQTWNTATSSCDGYASSMIWDDAMKNYSTGKTCDDWRLPRIDELYTITEHSKYKPAINSTIFPNTRDNDFWSSSVYSSVTGNAWSVYFGYGIARGGGKLNPDAVRLVRGGQFCSFDSSTTPTTDFIDNQDGTVTHKKTGLMWQRCSIGQTWNGSTCTGSAAYNMILDAATKQISTLANYNDWRLPTQNELKTIVEFNNYNPAINLSVFPNTSSFGWFSSSSVDASSGGRWLGEFYDGSDLSGSGDYDYNYLVRLVRGGQSSSIVATAPETIDLSAALVGNPTVKINENITYTATANNLSNANANNVALTLYLSPRVAKVISAPENCEIKPLSVVCNLGLLAANASVSKEITLNFNRAGGVSLSTSVRTSDTDSNKTNNKARVVTAIKK